MHSNGKGALGPSGQLRFDHRSERASLPPGDLGRGDVGPTRVGVHLGGVVSQRVHAGKFLDLEVAVHLHAAILGLPHGEVGDERAHPGTGGPDDAAAGDESPVLERQAFGRHLGRASR